MTCRTPFYVQPPSGRQGPATVPDSCPVRRYAVLISCVMLTMVVGLIGRAICGDTFQANPPLTA